MPASPGSSTSPTSPRPPPPPPCRTRRPLAFFGNPGVGLAWGARYGGSQAIRVEGGYRLSGTWSFASGGRHTTWMGAHSAVQNPDGTPHQRYGKPDDRSFVFKRKRREDRRRLVRAGPARHRQRHLYDRGPVHPRRACTGARRAAGAARDRAALHDGLDPALCQRLLQRDPGHRTPPARSVHRPGARQAQPRLDQRHVGKQCDPARNRSPRSEALGRPRLAACRGNRSL